LHERDLSRGVAGLQISVDEFLGHWLKTALKPKVRENVQVVRSHASQVHPPGNRPSLAFCHGEYKVKPVEFHVTRRKKIDLKKVLESLNAICPSCGHSISP
jgi:hypothetical protein